MTCLSTLFDLIDIKNAENASIAQLQREVILDSLRANFKLSTQQLRSMMSFMLHEMHEGLRPGSKSTLAMLPSFVYKSEPSHCHNEYYALDFGGTNCRILRLPVNHGKVDNVVQKSFKIPKTLIKAEGTKLFDFIAGALEQFLISTGHFSDGKVQAQLGFTFSFPILQRAINNGVLIKWGKEFSASGVEGKDVVELLEIAMKRRRISMNIAALCNDTVGTLIARYFEDNRAACGVIFGTGANGCYWEKVSELQVKYPEIQSRPKVKASADEMCVNTELGNFDSTQMLVLPETIFDAQLNAEAENPGAERLERMMSGGYLGELVRLILVKLAHADLLVSPGLKKSLDKAYTFDTELLSKIVEDENPGLERVEKLLRTLPYGELLNVTSADLKIIHEICELVIHRAAQLSGMAIAAILQKRNTQFDATVAVDGSVFEKVPGFCKRLEETLQTLLPENSNINLCLTRDGSGVGAGMIAALETSK